MKYKVLLISLLSTLAIPYGTAAERDCGREAGKGNPQREATEEEIAKHEAETQRINEQEAARSQQLITLVNCNLKVGGPKTVDLDQKFQTITEGIEIQKVSLENQLDNLNKIVADVSGDDLFEKAVNLIQESKKEKETEQALRREIEALKREQAETNALLDHVLKQSTSLVSEQFQHLELQPPSHPIPPSDAQPPVSSPVVTTHLSSYQQELLSRRNQIGDEAWKLLEGENPSLATALLNSIQQNQGMVEILSLEKNSFTLRVNGKEQYFPYKF